MAEQKTAPRFSSVIRTPISHLSLFTEKMFVHKRTWTEILRKPSFQSSLNSHVFTHLSTHKIQQASGKLISLLLHFHPASRLAPIED
jgi:hypothetical protein